MYNKKIVLFVTAILLITGLSITCAANVSDSTNDDNAVITQSAQNTKVADTTTVETNKKTITKNNKEKITAKKESKVHTINNETFETFFSSNGELSNSVQAGDTLDFQGEIFKNQSMLFRIPLTLTSTTNNAHINLNTTSTGYTGENTGSSFTLFKGASYSNVSNIYFENTQFFVKNATGIKLNNISTYVHKSQVGSGVGTVAIREFSDNITIENCHFKSENNGGVSTVVFSGVKNSIFRNNTITGIGYIGNLFYLNAYNLGTVSSDDTTVNVNNTIENNFINGTDAVAQAICYGVAICGEDNTFINNTIHYAGMGITTALTNNGNTLSVRSKIINNTVPYGEVQTPKEGIVQGNKIGTLAYTRSDSQITDNEITNVSVKTSNIHVNNVKAKGNLSLPEPADGIIISNSTFYNITLAGSSGNIKSNIRLLNNNITILQVGLGRYGYTSNIDVINNTITNPFNIMGRNNYNINIINNTIITDQNNTINASVSVNGLKIINNLLVSQEAYANETLQISDGNDLIIEDNYPIINISANLKLNSKGNISFKVESKEYTPQKLNVKINEENYEVDLENGTGNLEYTPKTENIPVTITYPIEGHTIMYSTDLTAEHSEKHATSIIITIPEEVFAGEEVELKVEARSDETFTSPQTISITINQETTLVQTDDNGKYSRTLVFNTPGNNEITVTFPETDEYYNSTNTSTCNVLESNSVIVNHENENITVGSTVTLETFITTGENLPVDNGIAIFRLNDKTLRDNQGKVIYAEIVNGKAILPEINVTTEWLKQGTNVCVVYSGEDGLSAVTKKTFINVVKPKASLTITSIPEVTAGETITLSANVTENGNPVNTGRVVFKLNGKTLKNEEGKALYVNVTNGVATIQYALPAKTKAKTYNLTAIFMDNLYERSEDNVDLVVTKNN